MSKTLISFIYKGSLSTRRTPQLLPAFSGRSTLSSGMFLEIGAMRSAGVRFRKALTASSLFSTLPHPTAKTSSSSSSVLSSKPLAFLLSNCSYMWTTTNRAGKHLQCRRACQGHSSPSTSRLAAQMTPRLSLAVSRGSTLDACAKWKSNRGLRSSKWWSEQMRIRIYGFWEMDAHTLIQQGTLWRRH